MKRIVTRLNPFSQGGPQPIIDDFWLWTSSSISVPTELLDEYGRTIWTGNITVNGATVLRTAIETAATKIVSDRATGVLINPPSTVFMNTAANLGDPGLAPSSSTLRQLTSGTVWPLGYVEVY